MMAKATPREKTLQMRVTDEEFLIIEEKAKLLGLSVSNYMRMVCLHARLDISIQPEKSKS
ncbi:MAG: hypothetical protein M1308_13615 [Actinobacteria bacterium]|nr:hypothetical protein [Actinomycetota bacterium]